MTKPMTKTNLSIDIEDLYDIACLCHAAMAQDAPATERDYINRILNLVWPHLSKHYKQKIEVYLAEKEYLPPAPKIELITNQ